jgi:hypothetical protein
MTQIIGGRTRVVGTTFLFRKDFAIHGAKLPGFSDL